MSEIKAGDNGTVLELLIRDKGAIVPLNGAIVDAVIKNGARRFVKQAVRIVDPANGICETLLTREDLANSGRYQIQGVVKYPSDGDKDFASDVVYFQVGYRI
ncbi:hypothetical protein [Bacillus sp. T33-2]|uniref:hypothetical protein n=1 Tax=Bacillus sp. T33-2 TaxID=2054168 RepID=UPI000C78FC79|nr:hypothetical protein [Bacillus sp. T33-2]PLR93177.1 hypothetical protein CVD19_19410 [Bacillus sp. T33-2]